MSTERYLKEISDILKRETRSFSSIHELLVLEQKCLVECDTPGLANLLQRQEDILTSVACLEKSRVEVLAKISAETETPVNDLTITVLAGMADENRKKELLENGHLLSRLQEDIRRQKIRNNLLINQAIMMVESDIRLILNAVNSAGKTGRTYSSNARNDGSPGGVCLDQRL